MSKIGKIVELLIDWENMEFEDLGVDIMSLVDKPAIGISWQAFSEHENIEMIDGIVELLNQVDDIENRKEMAKSSMDAFIEDEIEYDQDDFLRRIGLHLMPNGELMEGPEHEMNLEDACWPGWEAIGMKTKNGKQVPNCVPIENSEIHFESYNDYPESAKNNAQRAIDWAEENGWGSCGTDVGKQRAHQLAKGENISEDTIARMSAFARHKKNSKTPYSEGCGKLMWDAWGGTSGIEWASSKLKKIRLKQSEEEVDPIILMASQPDFGEVLDYANTIEISESQANFSDFTDTLKGIIGLDILGQKNPTDEGEIKYRYAGPNAQRTFCRAMLRLNKVYTEEEIGQMNSFNPGFGLRGASIYDIFKYKGGNNCRHYWEKVRVFREGRRTVVVNEGRAEGLAAIPMEEQPNGGRVTMSEFTFADDDQMIITGPAMTPNVLIPRKDEDGNIFHVYFTAETIEKISRKFMYDSNQNNTDINHDDNITTENVLLESWIVEDPDNDKSKALGFDVPKSTWMVSYKINNEETWKMIKDGKIVGFSITGQFIEKATK